MRFREGDFIEDFNGIIFDVKGLVHPPNRVVAFPRFIPNTAGERKRGIVSYTKVYSLAARYKFLEKEFPGYLIRDEVFGERICEVPVDCIKRHYSPIDRLRELRDSNRLDSLERHAVEFASLLKESANIRWNALGISGSILSGLHRSTSDIDPIVYGQDTCRGLHSALKSLLADEKGTAKPYNEEKQFRQLFDFRSKDTNMRFEDFVRVESRKVLQGRYRQHDYFIRFVKNWNEINERYGDVKYSNAGYAKVKGNVINASEAIFTPCAYKIANVRVLSGNVVKPISEVASFRGRFCEQAEKGETIVAQGKLEQVRNKEARKYFRLLLGNTPSDFMTLAQRPSKLARNISVHKSR